MAAHRVDSVVQALRGLGGQARPVEIAAEIRRIFPQEHPPTLLNSVRGRIQECSSDSLIWKGKRDLFYSVYGIGHGVWGLRETDPLNPSNEDGFTDDAEPYLANEGAAVLKAHLRRERSKRLVKRFKRNLKSFTCVVCTFDFSRRYGEIGEGFIEAHHVVPLAQLAAGSRTRIEDLAPVCSNCHRMLHRSGGGMSMDELRRRLIPPPS